MPPSPFSIVETAGFLDSLQDFRIPHRIVDHLLEGVLFVIARNPREGVRISPSSRVWALAFDSPDREERSLVLYYTFDVQKIYLLALRPSHED